MKKKVSKISEKICNKIRFERLKRNIAQEELAFNAGISRNGLSKIETGKSSPKIETVEFIAEALGMDFMELIDVSKVEL